MKILIVGGYGTFGRRLTALLADDERLRLIIAGRNLDAAQRFCDAQKGRAQVRPLRLDRAAPEAALAEVKPDLVVDASGPFQMFAEDPYRLARACLAAGADYIDLADGSAFVTGITALQELALQTGRFALSGMSSFPALSGAAVRALAQGLGEVAEIRSGVAPSPFAGVGPNVIAAIASYAGKPLAVLADGRWSTRTALVDSCRLRINVPGEAPLGPIRFALVDVPDLGLLPAEWPGLRMAWAGAGPRPALLHRLLWTASWLVRWRLLASLSPLAPVMQWAAARLRWGERRGGMIVEVRDRQGRSRSWHLLAPEDSGPFVPAIAAAVIIRRCLAGQRPAAGARPGHRDTDLADYLPLFTACGIRTGVRASGETGPVYAQSLGEAFARLAPPLRRFHCWEGDALWSGRAHVRRGKGAMARLVALLFGFTAEGDDVPVRVRVRREAGVECWERDFAGHRFSSRHQAGRGDFEGLVEEQFGPFRFGLALVEEAGALRLVMRRWAFLGLPLPRWAMPASDVRESGEDGLLHFDVTVALPLAGPLMSYAGWLKPEEG